MKYLIDTSAWIEALRVDGDKEMKERVRSILSDGAACWNKMIQLELWNGAKGVAEKHYLKALEVDMLNLNILESTWRLAINLAEKARSKGLTIPSTDLLIYASSLEHHILILHKDKHFSALEKL